MKKRDLNRLKELCEKEGFEVKQFSINPTSFIIEKKDPWEGVEFARVGKIHKIKKMTEYSLIFENGTWGYKDKCVPSTEEAYVEQLKKEAFERFKVGFSKDTIDYSNLHGGCIEYSFKDEVFTYRKDTDTLYCTGFPIYQQGKWAEKIESVEVEFHKVAGNSEGQFFGFKISNPVFDRQKAGEYLAKCLEEYLNEEAPD